MATLKNVQINDTGNLRIPAGTTAQRPTAATGLLRYNTNLSGPEFYTGVAWTPLVPTGAIEFFARSSAPAGWVKANGAGLSTTTYAALFASIGYTFGGGGATFNVPDMRGEFSRSWDDGRTLDNGRGFGTFQNEDWKTFFQSNTGSNTFSYSHGPVYMGKSGGFTGNLFGGGWRAPAAALGTAWDSSPIRPRNVALLACIKY
jgi:hypothetical protein